MKLFTAVGAAAVLVSSAALAQSTSDQAVVRLDPALDALVSPDAKVELVKSGFGFTEGPVWVQNGKSGYLLFTDTPGNVIWKLNPQDGSTSVFPTMPAFADRMSGDGAPSRTMATSAPIRVLRNSP